MRYEYKTVIVPHGDRFSLNDYQDWDLVCVVKDEMNREYYFKKCL